MGFLAGAVTAGMAMPAVANSQEPIKDSMFTVAIESVDNLKTNQARFVVEDDDSLPLTEMYKIAIGNFENGSVTSDVSEAQEGRTITLTIMPGVGYKLEKLTVKDESGINEITVENMEDGIYSFVMPAFNVVIDSSFALDDTSGLPIHTASETWSSDEKSHWHECVDGDGEKLDIGAHEFGEWTVEKEVTDTEPGLQSRSCTICGYSEKQEVPVEGFEKPHIHTASETWSYDGLTHWHECVAADGEKLEVGNHDFSEWVIEKEPTDTEPGLQNRICSVCGYKESENIPVISSEQEHSHTASSEWAFNEESHWHECISEDGEKLEEASHDFGDWTVEKEATPDEPGVKSRFCSVCGYSEEESIEPTAQEPTKELPIEKEPEEDKTSEENKESEEANDQPAEAAIQN